MNNKTFFVNVWVTLRCNYRCRYCYEKSRYANKDITRSTIDDIILFIKENIKQDQELIVNFHGGEPIINFGAIKYFVKKITREISNEMFFGVTTNGSLLTDETINFLGEKFDYNLSISIDGKRETHNLNRICIQGNIEYDVILENALKLLEINKNTRIRMTFDNKNVSLLAENIIFFVEHGFKIIVPVADFCSENWSDIDFSNIEKEFLKVKEYLIRNKIENVDIYEISDTFTCLSPCTAGESYYNIDPYGDIYACTFLVGDKKHLIGNITKGINKKCIEKLDDIKGKRIEECEECKLYDYCISTRCLLINYAINGDYYKPNLVNCNMLNVKLNISEDNNKETI